MRNTTMLTLLLCAAVCLLAGCPKDEALEEAGGGSMAARPLPVFVEPVVQQDYANAVTLIGEMRAAQRTVLTAEVSGVVSRIAHRVGESHSAGVALIQIDPSNYEVSLASARAQLTQAEENLRRAQAGPRAQEIAAQEAQVAAAKAQADQAQDYLERQRKLYAAGVTAETTLIAAETSAEAAVSALEAQQQVLDQLLEGSRPEDIAVAEAAVDAARSGVEAAEIALGKTHVSPPFPAVVTALYVEQGQYASPGTPLAEVVADGAGEGWFNLPTESIGRIEPGNTVEIRCDAYPDEVFTGQIISISPQADESTRQFPTRVSIADERLLPGIAIEGRLYLEDPKPTIMVPRDAVTSSSLGEVVYMMQAPAGGGSQAAGALEGGEASQQLPTVKMMVVSTGDTAGLFAVLLEGDLKPGMMVVSRGNEQLYDGAMIAPTNLMGGEGGEAPSGGSADQPGGGEAAAGDNASGQPSEPAEGAGE